MLRLKPIEAYPSPRESSFRISSFAGGVNMSIDEQNLSMNESPMAYNVEFANGCLKRCKGMGKAIITLADDTKMSISPMPQNTVLSFMKWRDNNTNNVQDVPFIQTSDYRLYRGLKYPSTDVLIWDGVNITGEAESHPITYSVNYKLNDQNVMIFGTGESYAYVYKGELYALSQSSTPNFTKATMQNERMFGVGDYGYTGRTHFSEPFKPLNFTPSLTEGGFIDMIGNLGSTKNILAFGNSVFVFWQFGITRIVAGGSQVDFSATEIYSCDSEILQNSIQLCGNKIIFCCRDGVYVFNGMTAQCISKKIAGLFADNQIRQSNECSSYFKGKYYLSLNVAALQEEISQRNNVLLEFDTTNGLWCIYKDTDIRHMQIIHYDKSEKLIFIREACDELLEWNETEKFFDTPISAKWQSPESDLGSPNVMKTITSVRLNASGTGSVRVTVCADGKQQTRELNLRNNKRTVRLRYTLKGIRVSVTIENVDGAYFEIDNPMVIFNCEEAL